MIVALGCGFSRQAFRQVARELLELWREPLRQFRSHCLGRGCVSGARMFLRLVPKLFNGLGRLICDSRASCGKLLLPLFE